MLRRAAELLAYNTIMVKEAKEYAREPESRVGRVIDRKYLLDGVLGVGSLGAVYSATQLNLERQVAIKLLRSDAASPLKVKRLQREALTIARLRHPNIVTIFDSAETPSGEPYIVMELLRGPTLREELAREGPPTYARAARIAIDICAAVHAAHLKDVIHRDIKPDNVMLEGGPHGPVVKVLDFGIAKLCGENDLGRTTLTSHKARLGTPMYMSPEQAAGHAVDRRSDVYAIGCLLYELLTGRPPFAGRTVAMILLKHRGEHPRPPQEIVSTVPEALGAEVLRALEKEPSARHQTAEALALALEPFGNASGDRNAPETVGKV